MRRLVFTALSAILVSATIGSLSPAAAARYCLQGSGWGYPGNCQYSSFRECRAAASGTNAGCGVNPRYAYAHQPSSTGRTPRRISSTTLRGDERRTDEIRLADVRYPGRPPKKINVTLASATQSE